MAISFHMKQLFKNNLQTYNVMIVLQYNQPPQWSWALQQSPL